MRFLMLAILACGLMGCEMSKKTTPNSTTIEIEHK